jgi:hypothetical protein
MVPILINNFYIDLKIGIHLSMGCMLIFKIKTSQLWYIKEVPNFYIPFNVQINWNVHKVSYLFTFMLSSYRNASFFSSWKVKRQIKPGYFLILAKYISTTFSGPPPTSLQMYTDFKYSYLCNLYILYILCSTVHTELNMFCSY